MIDDVVWVRVTDILQRPNVIAEQLGKHRGDGGLERDLAALDKRLADIATKQTNLARRLALVSDDAAADDEKLRTLTDWCRHVGTKLNNATYEQKRQALEALGVDVRVYRVGATDDAGNPLPRWKMPLYPLALGDPIVYGQAPLPPLPPLHPSIAVMPLRDISHPPPSDGVTPSPLDNARVR